MAKSVTATKGGLTVTDGYLAVTGARFVSFFEEETGVPVKVERWIVDWKLYPSQAEAEIVRNSGVAIEQGQIFMAYDSNKNPIDEAYKVLVAELGKKWTVTASSDKP